MSPQVGVAADLEEELELDIKLQNKSGQAMIEFCIGLIAMLTVITGILQFARIGIARTQTRTEATAHASALSMREPSDTFVHVRPFVLSVQDGEDGRSYSVDDTRHLSGDETAYARILANNNPEFLRTVAPENSLSWINDSIDMQASTGLVQARNTEIGIPILPLVRRLFWDRNSVDVQAEVWSVETGGLY